eukprot:11766603-Alexandrium_andersonii.AAC.1
MGGRPHVGRPLGPGSGTTHAWIQTLQSECLGNRLPRLPLQCPKVPQLKAHRPEVLQGSCRAA